MPEEKKKRFAIREDLEGVRVTDRKKGSRVFVSASGEAEREMMRHLVAAANDLEIATA